MGVLLKVPELRGNLESVTGGNRPDGSKLATIVKDWVGGTAVSEIARRHFLENNENETRAMTKCCQNLFGNLALTAAWGLGALLSITGGRLSEEQFRSASNLPSRIYYGVNSDEAVTLRLLGVPRTAATRLSGNMGNLLGEPLATVRGRLRNMDENSWGQALGVREGRVYRGVWRALEGLARPIHEGRL